MQFFKGIRKKKVREVTAKDALRLVLQLQEKHQNIEEMEREKGNHLIADIHRNKRHGNTHSEQCREGLLRGFARSERRPYWLSALQTHPTGRAEYRYSGWTHSWQRLCILCSSHPRQCFWRGCIQAFQDRQDLQY